MHRVLGPLEDVSGLQSVSITGDLVAVGPGVRLGPLADELAVLGRTLPSAYAGTAAIALNGGLGPLARYHGLLADQLVAAQVVLADGRVVTADETHEPDLFWALRGGGAHFGVVTELVLRTAPVSPLTSFAAWWPAELAADLLDTWQRWAPLTTGTLNCLLVLRTSPGGEQFAGVSGVLVGDDGGSIRFVLDELAGRIGRPPERTRIEPMVAGDTSYLRRFGGEELRRVKSEFFEHLLPRTAIEDLVTHWRDAAPGVFREITCVPWGQALSRVPADATAFVHRNALFMIASTSSFDPAWASASKAIVHPWGSSHVYQNHPDPELLNPSHAHYGSNLHRLIEIKAQYDPEWTFGSKQPLQLAR